MPVLMVSLKTWPQVGFSRKRSIDPSSSVITMPNSSGFSTALQGDGGQRPARLVERDHRVRSMSVSTSPEITRKRSSSSSRALRTEPAVPSGVYSVA